MLEDFQKMQDLLFRTSKGVSHAYGSFPDYVRDYMNRFVGNTYILTREEVIMQLRACHKKNPCGFVHEFSILRASCGSESPPYDLTGFIHGPNTCPNRLLNCLCAHSDILGLVLRALIITNREDRASDLLKPIFDMMVHDGQFATIVQMGEAPYLMDESGLNRQAQTGERIMKTVEDTLELLS